MRLPRPCAEPGCPHPTKATRCEKHQKEREDKYEARRPSSTERGYDARHREWRGKILARDPICRICGQAEATVADHIIPIRDGGPRFDLRNGQGLCSTCHNSRKQSQEKARG